MIGKKVHNVRELQAVYDICRLQTVICVTLIISVLFYNNYYHKIIQIENIQMKVTSS